MITSYPKRLIEVDLPIKLISEHARREKSIRHGHISTLHIWWARRPLAACRTVLCAALWPDPADEQCPQAFRDAAAKVLCDFAEKVRTNAMLAGLCQRHWSRWQRTTPASLKADVPQCWPDMRYALLDFIADFANWDASNVPAFLNAARALTLAAHEALGGNPGTRPLVVDPFAGGGSIPLEALRVGADAFASDLNPVAVLLNKVLLEYIPKYGQQLANEVRKWGMWIKEQAEKKLDEFYPKDLDGATPIAYLWARTITCEGPGCGAEIPLMRSLWLAKRGNHSVALRMFCNQQEKRVDFEIIQDAKARDVGEGTIRRGSATCPVCGYTTPATNVRSQFVGRKGGTDDARLISVATINIDKSGRSYRVGSDRDVEVVKRSKERLQEKIKKHQVSRNLIPDEELPYLRSIFNIHLLDVNQWCHLFTSRQLLSLTNLWSLLRERVSISYTNDDPGIAKACATCIALAIDRLSAQFTSLSRWQPKGEFVVGTFGRQALGIIWDFAEIRPIAGASGDLDGAIDWIVQVLEEHAKLRYPTGQVEIASATKHPLPNDSSAVLFTDPPYYDAVPYADLSDFFYVQLKRMIADIYPALFIEDLTPKYGEIVQLAERNTKYSYKTKEYFENNMRDALSEGRRFLELDGVGIVVFAHKTTGGWEAMLSSLIDAGWTTTASWPVDTERSMRMRAQGSAALGSSIHIVCRPRKNPDGSLRTDDIGDWRDVLHELPGRIHEWMPRLATEGVVGADAIFSCLGPALEVFSRYSRVERADGEQVTLKEYLEYVWAAVSREALDMIFLGADTSGFEPDARLTAMWLWTLSTNIPTNGNGQNNGKTMQLEEEEGEEDEEETPGPRQALGGYMLEFDAARKIAQGLGAHLERLQSLVEIKGSTARLRPVMERGRFLFEKDAGEVQVTKPHKKEKVRQLAMFSVQELAEESDGGGDLPTFSTGRSMLDRLHQSMLLFAAGRSNALKRFLQENGVGQDQRFWRLAQALSALYPPGSEERRWVEGVQGYKKGLGL